MTVHPGGMCRVGVLLAGNYQCHLAYIGNMHEFHETCHCVTFIVLVNSHQR